MEHMQIRMATIDDLDAITSVEAECFPAAEASTREEFARRIKAYGPHFWLLCEEGYEKDKIIAFVDGMVTNEKNLTDEMYEKAELHDEGGAWQMIFGVSTLPAYRRRGYAEKLMRYVINDARAQDRTGMVLTCKESLIHYYEKFGFQNEGISESVHGGAVWYQMRLIF